jgi:hypothetical protein
MSAQNYSAVDAYGRWRDTDLRAYLRVIRRNYVRYRLGGLPTSLEYRTFPKVSRFAKWRTVVFGRVVWGVFARAYWAIYQPGVSSLFYGSVLYSNDVSDEGSPSLFEISEYSRRVMDYDVPLDGIEEYAKVIRDDHSLPDPVEVPTEIAAKRGVFLQTIGIERAKLPRRYLHHRLVPIVKFRGSGFASIIHHAYWGAEFRGIWSTGDPLLSEQELAAYRADSPEITP